MPFFDILSIGFPSSEDNPRGWAKCLSEAKDFVKKISNNTENDIILNIVGHSRGGILGMWLASDVAENEKIKTINIIAYDPVPGDNLIPLKKICILNKKIKNYIGFYAEDERSMFFEPVIPHAADTEKTNVFLIRVPGTHETLVGNYQKDGHSVNFHAVDWYELNDDWKKEKLLPVCLITRFITQKFFDSKGWGSVRFLWEYNNPDKKIQKNIFLKWFKQMKSEKSEEYYAYQRTISFIPFILPATSITVFLDGQSKTLNAFQISKKMQNLPRSALVVQKEDDVRFAALQNYIKPLNSLSIWKKLEKVK